MLAAANGFVVVALGAFGAHLLEGIISSDMLAVFNTGIRYHMFHVAGLIAVALLAALSGGSARLGYCPWLFLTGIVLFCGSLYLLALTGMSALGMITPLGGVAFLCGWALLCYEGISALHD